MAISTLPVRTSIAPSNPELIGFAEVILAAKNAGLDLSTLFGGATIVDEAPVEVPVARFAPVVKSAPKVKQTTPRAPKTTKKADVKSAPNMREIHDGRMMNADPSTITSGQVKRIGNLHTDFDFTGCGVVTPKGDMSTWSMADAADYYHALKSLI